jgi:hypothetical protein
MPVDVEVIAAGVAACPSVARLYPGRAAEVATYLPGRRVEGVRVADDELEVHVVAAWDVPLPLVADEVRDIATPLSEGLPVAVYIDDVDIPAALLGAEEPSEDGAEAPPQAGAPLPGDLSAAAGSPAAPATTAPPEVPVSPVPTDPLLDPVPPEPAAPPGMLPTPPAPTTSPPPGDPAADVLPGAGLPDDVVLEDEIPGDVIPGEPVAPPPPTKSSRGKRSSKRRSGGSK